MNVNAWLSPDRAVLDKSAGGLLLYPVLVDSDQFSDINSEAFARAQQFALSPSIVTRSARQARALQLLLLCCFGECLLPGHPSPLPAQHPQSPPLLWWHHSRHCTSVATVHADARARNDLVRIPYRANRAVVFDSHMLHSTDEFSFRPGFASQRINLTFLFGDAHQGCVAGQAQAVVGR